MESPRLPCIFPVGRAWRREKRTNLLFFTRSNNITLIYELDTTSWNSWTLQERKIWNPGTSRGGKFPPESFNFPCNQASLLRTNRLREYFLSVEAMQRIKSKTEKRKQSFTVLFVAPFALHFMIVLIEDKVELTHVIAHYTWQQIARKSQSA